ncbi:MAG: T9SS type A sorting domain-containing protein [Candidatus Delongbacteria bacterium]|nr:T9SS type A sorting domain-containing protein [Candidatus Delongbacteria bacterium]
MNPMKSCNHLLSILLLLWSCRIGAGELSEWISYTDKSGISDLISTPDAVYTATTGGLSIYHPESSRFTWFTNADGLSGTYLSTLSFDEDNYLWIGSNGNYLSLQSPDGRFQTFDQYDGVSEIIHAIASDSVSHTTYVAGNQGIAIFRQHQFYTRISSSNGLQLDENHDLLITSDTLWVLSDSGLCYASIGSNLSNPAVWTRLNRIGTEPITQFHRIIYYNQTYYLLHDNQLLSFNYQEGELVLNSIFRFSSVSPFTDIVMIGDSAYLTAGDGLYVFPLDDPLRLSRRVSEEQLTSLSYDPSRHCLWLGSFKNGLSVYYIHENRHQLCPNPNGPISNIIEDIDFDSDGTVALACGFDYSVTGKSGGISFLNNNQWHNFHPPVNNQDFRSVAFDKQNTWWFGSFGSGLVRAQRLTDSIHYSVYDHTNSPLSGQTSSYVPIPRIIKDQYGNIWLSDLHIGLFIPVNPDQNQWISFGVGAQLYNIEIWALAVYYNDVWMGTRKDGIYHLNYGRSILSPDPQWSVINDASEDDLYSNQINDISIDLQGNPWVGTLSGPIFRYGSAWYSPWEDPQDMIKSRINAIYVDEYNNKYYGTDDKGLLVAIGDTLQWFYFNTTNSPILSNSINRIKIHPITKEIYLATDKGLNVIRDPFLVPHATQDSIKIYPNPFMLNSYRHHLVNFENLTPFSTICIFTVDGTLVKKLTALSGTIGKITWDGLDDHQNPVAPGLYLVQIMDANHHVKGKKLIIK